MYIVAILRYSCNIELGEATNPPRYVLLTEFKEENK